jgi:hypothetical protein
MLTISASFTGMIKNKKGIVVSLHEDRNAQLHVKVERKSMAVLLEPYKKIVTQGIEEGHFNTDHPEESILTMIAMSSAILDTPDEVAEVAERPFLPKASGLTKQMESNVEALFDITERILGAKKGIFRKEAEKMKK